MAKILVCDDDKEIVEAIEIYLGQEGHQILRAYDGEEALKILETEKDVELLIIGVMMPKLDGIRATLKVREANNIPIIILSAKSEDADKILGLNIGADDYVTKPFNPVELLARVKSQLRRYLELGSAPVRKSVFRIGDIELDDTAKEVRLMGEKVSLTPKEYGILKFFLEHPGQVFSPAEIYHAVWEETAYGAEGTVAVHIRHLREKLEINPEQPRHLKVVWGQEYKIE